MGLSKNFSRTAASLGTAGAIHLVASAAGVPPFISGVAAGAELARMALGFVSPYALGNFRAYGPDAADNASRNGDLSPTSMARLISHRDDGSGRALTANDYLARFISPEQEKRSPDIMVPGGAASLLQNRGTFDRFVAPGQERRALDSAYDYGRIRAEIDTLADRHRDYSGLDKPTDPQAGLPLQTIRDREGRILMQGAAVSPEALIAQKLKEAETTTDPTKKVVNLAGADLEGMSFKGFKFTNVDLRGANMAKCEIEDCKFENVDAEGLNLKGARLRNSHFENVNLNGFIGDDKTKFQNCTMLNVHMAGAEAPGVKFEGIRAENLNIANADFSGSSWTDIQVHNMWARGAKLEGAKLGDFHVAGPDSNFDDVKMNGAQVNDASFGRPGQGLSMRNLQAANSTWSNVQFNAADLSGANFTNVWFRHGVDMRDVITPQGPMNMDGANLTGLIAGPQAKIAAASLTYGEGANQVMMRTQGGAPMIFDGTGQIENLYKVARTNNLSYIHIREVDGIAIDPVTGKELSEQISAPGLVQHRRAPKPTMAGPAPPSPFGRKKDTPWG